jgi:hypothetical protein
VLRCLEKDPRRRYAAAGELADDLGRWLRGESPRVKPDGWPGWAWRQVRRRPLVSAGLCLVLLVAAASPAVREYADPDHPLRVAEGRLGRGVPAPLVGESGPPPWWRPGLGDVNLIGSPENDRTFTVSAVQPCLVELLPRPPRAYRLRAEVRHHDSARGGQVGVYFGFSSPDAGGGRQPVYATLNFNDIEAPYWNQERRELESAVQVTLHFDHDSREPRALAVHSQPLTPSRVENPGPCPWRHLTVENRPDAVVVSWEGEQLWEVSRGDLVAAFKPLKQTREALDGWPDLNPQFSPEEPLGLYVSFGVASFRRVVVEPLR